jgi:ABC-type Fe3+/spermidine/putrescine transport system ATPase subunit
MIATAAVLSAENVIRRYHGRTVVDVAALHVRRGEVLAILGPNGAGKSTLFRLLLLLEAADAGVIRVNGAAVHVGDPAARSLAGVFQRPYLFSGTVESNVAYGLRARGMTRSERSARVAEALELLGIASLRDTPVYRLSVGEAQRVALARALAVRPDVLLLDEPTANLDVTAKRRFREDVERTVSAGKPAAILITHDPADAFALADRIAVMQDGRIIQEGEPDDLVFQPASPFVAAMTGAELLLDGVVDRVDDGLITVRLGAGVHVVAVAADAGSGLTPGRAVHVGYRPEDVVLADPVDAGATSAINRFAVRVSGMAPSGALVRARLEGEIRLTSLVTRQSAEALGLGIGRPIIVQLKATALRAFAAGE